MRLLIAPRGATRRARISLKLQCDRQASMQLDGEAASLVRQTSGERVSRTLDYLEPLKQ